jgi:hypothetical protein
MVLQPGQRHIVRSRAKTILEQPPQTWNRENRNAMGVDTKGTRKRSGRRRNMTTNLMISNTMESKVRSFRNVSSAGFPC